MSYPIGDIKCFDSGIAAKLRAIGIRTSDKLLDAAKSLRGRKTLSEKTGIDEQSLLRLANKIDRMRVKGIGQDYADLLQLAGVDTVRELKYRNPKRLAEAMAEANAKRKLVRVLPSERTVGRWIEHAKKLPLKITY
jgi:Domain of unknown function (DUF4332)